MILKRVLCIALVLLTALSTMLSGMIVAFAEDFEEFAGNRSVTYSVDKSDLENFISGGRSALDILLRSNSPSWLKYTLSAENRNVNVSFAFDFVSYNDYSGKLSELLSYSPTVIYSNEDGLLLLENFSALDMLGFLESKLESSGLISEQSFSDIFSVEGNSIKIGESIYDSENERINIRPGNESVIKVDSLNISSTEGDGVFARKITVELDTTKCNEDEPELLAERFNKVGKAGKTESDLNIVKISVRFEAKSLTELIADTITCLNVASYISEQETFVNNTTVGVIRTEFIDLTELMRDTPNFEYSLEYPSYYKKVKGSNEYIIVSDESVSAENQGLISISYERGFKFTLIEINNDFSNLFGKKQKTITFSAPTIIAEQFHEKIKKVFKSRIIKGTVLNIYDEFGMRYYELTYSSFFADDIGEFSKAVLNTSYEIEFNNSWIPFGESEFKDTIAIGNVIPQMAPCSDIRIKYIFSPLSNIRIPDMFEDAEKSGSILTFTATESGLMVLDYRELNVIKCGIELLILILIIIIILCAVSAVKKKIRSRTKPLTSKITKRVSSINVIGNLNNIEASKKENFWNVPSETESKVDTTGRKLLEMNQQQHSFKTSVAQMTNVAISSDIEKPSTSANVTNVADQAKTETKMHSAFFMPSSLMNNPSDRPEIINRCPQCGSAIVSQDQKFCDNCGYFLKK